MRTRVRTSFNLRLCSALALASVISGCDIQHTPVSGPGSSPTPAPSPDPVRMIGVSTPTPPLAPTPTPVPKPTPTPTPLPQTFIPYQNLDVSKIFNGVRLKTGFKSTQGDLASVEVADPNSYTVDVQINVRVPKASATLDELAKVNPQIGTVLPGLAAMLPTAKVSDFYHGLYDLKVKFIAERAKRLERIVTAHNFFDCQTILELQHPETKRKALLIQTEMDVDTDGSDSDRLVNMDVTSSSFQPYTSYKWSKRTPVPNPFLAPRQKKLDDYKKEFAQKGVSIDRNRELRTGIEDLTREIRELQNYSFLISKTEPFIVLPGFMLRQTGQAFTPQLGDYAAVIYNDKIYPAIFGDVGPSYKMGEASYRICLEIDPKSNGNRRALDNLKATYLVFPGTAEKPFGPPDIVKWQQRVTALLDEIGGVGGTVRVWENLLPTPTPTPTPDPSASPAPGATPQASPAPTPGSPDDLFEKKDPNEP